MRAFKKALLATLSVGVVSVAVAASAMAAAPTISSPEYADGTVSVAVENGTADEQLTVVIFKDGAASDANGLESGEILYIDQDAGNANIFTATTAMGLKGNYVVPAENDTTGDGTLSYGTYTIRVGGSNYDAFAEATFEITAPEDEPQFTYGDCDGIDGIDGRDPAAILKYIAGTLDPTFTEVQLLAADCDGISGIDGRDPSAVLKYIAGTRTADLGTAE